MSREGAAHSEDSLEAGANIAPSEWRRVPSCPYGTCHQARTPRGRERVAFTPRGNWTEWSPWSRASTWRSGRAGVGA